jgi:dTDP-4-dehydrorhamnose reductase
MERATRILITGGSGRIGFRCCRAAAETGLDVHATWHSWEASWPGVIFHRLNLTDRIAVHALLDELRPDGVLHLAALIREQDSRVLQKHNVEATEHLISWCGRRGVHLCYASTDLVFDGTKGLYTEDDPVNPQDPYAESKFLAESAVRDSGIDSAVVRLPISYGWTPRGGTFSEWLIDELAREATVPLFCDQYRSPIFLDNLAQVLTEIMSRRITGLFHIGGTDRVSRYDLGKAILTALGIPLERVRPAQMCEISYQGTRCPDVSMDVARARRVLATTLLGVREGTRLLAERRPQSPP